MIVLAAFLLFFSFCLFYFFFFFDLLYVKELESLNYDEIKALGRPDSELGPAAMKMIETV